MAYMYRSNLTGSNLKAFRGTGRGGGLKKFEINVNSLLRNSE